VLYGVERSDRRSVGAVADARAAVAEAREADRGLPNSVDADGLTGSVTASCRSRMRSWLPGCWLAAIAAVALGGCGGSAGPHSKPSDSVASAVPVGVTVGRAHARVGDALHAKSGKVQPAHAAGSGSTRVTPNVARSVEAVGSGSRSRVVRAKPAVLRVSSRRARVKAQRLEDLAQSVDPVQCLARAGVYRVQFSRGKGPTPPRADVHASVERCIAQSQASIRALRSARHTTG
jgi:hypothetical protein